MAGPQRAMGRQAAHVVRAVVNHRNVGDEDMVSHRSTMTPPTVDATEFLPKNSEGANSTRGPSWYSGQTCKWRHEGAQRRSQQSGPEPLGTDCPQQIVASVRVQSNPELDS